MIDLFDKSTQKTIKVGDIDLNLQVENAGIKLTRTDFCGIDLLTDSPHLAEVVKLCPRNSLNKGEISLLYLIGSALPIFSQDRAIIKAQDKDFGGEIYTNRSLTTYGFSGIDSFGTMSHLVFGIRSFGQVNEGTIGIHASALYDQKCSGLHLLVGPTGIGKSSLGMALEMSDPDRYQLIGDDWVEVDVINGAMAKVISPVLSSNGVVKNQNPLFSSFKGKQYFKAPSYAAMPEKSPVLSLTELHPREDMSFETFLKKSMYFIPFLISNEVKFLEQREKSNESDNILTELVEFRNLLYRTLYRTLTRDFQLPHIVNDYTKSIDHLTSIIKDQLEHNE